MDTLSLALKLLVAVIFTTVHSIKINEDLQKSIKISCMEKCQPLAFHRLVGIKQSRFICFYVSEAKPLCFSLSSQMFDDVKRC